MQTTPKSMRLQIGLFGRTNVGKSSFLNMIAAQDVAVTSSIPGTTTDVVEKAMELLPLGPVMFLDTAGIDDKSELSEARIRKTNIALERAEVCVLITEAGIWSEFEDKIASEASVHKIPLIVIVNKADKMAVTGEFLEKVKEKTDKYIICSSVDLPNRQSYVMDFKQKLIEAVPEEVLRQPSLVGDLFLLEILQYWLSQLIFRRLRKIDFTSGAGDQDALDNDAATLVVKERVWLCSSIS